MYDAILFNEYNKKFWSNSIPLNFEENSLDYSKKSSNWRWRKVLRRIAKKLLNNAKVNIFLCYISVIYLDATVPCHRWIVHCPLVDHRLGLIKKHGKCWQGLWLPIWCKLLFILFWPKHEFCYEVTMNFPLRANFSINSNVYVLPGNQNEPLPEIVAPSPFTCASILRKEVFQTFQS